jgi:phosphosulfolactate phosphohydrolase-like enzyme
MSIKILWPWELPQTLNGIAVVTDVYAATTNIATFLARGVKKLIIVSEKNISQARKKFKDVLVVGDKFPKHFFDVSNLPHDIEKVVVEGKTILYTTANGAQVIRMAMKKGAHQTLAVSFLNINSIAAYLKSSKPKNIFIIPAGEISRPCQEDLICAQTLKDILQGKKINWKKTLKFAEKFIRSFYQPKYNQVDFKIMFNLNKYKVIPSCLLIKDGLITVKDASKNPPK